MHARNGFKFFLAVSYIVYVMGGWGWMQLLYQSGSFGSVVLYILVLAIPLFITTFLAYKLLNRSLPDAYLIQTINVGVPLTLALLATELDDVAQGFIFVFAILPFHWLYALIIVFVAIFRMPRNNR